MQEQASREKEAVVLYSPENGLKINRLFTAAGKDPLETIECTNRSSVIRNQDGSVVFELKDVEVPETWSQVATDILAQKYFRKAGVPLFKKNGSPLLDESGKQVTGSEKSAKQIVKRLAGSWRYWGEKYGYFASKGDAQAFEDEMKYMLINQIGSPNSPQWFNTGLALFYDIRGPPQGHWYVDNTTRELKQSEDAYTRQQCHACFIQSLSDDLVNEGGIFDLVLREARVFKYGSGTGSNFSSLRGKGEKLSGGGSSSGLMSFLKIFDRAAGAVKCLHEDTELVTKKGIVKIKEIKKGDSVLTKNGYKEVNQVFDNGTKEMVRVKTGLGFEVTCTPEHMFWVRTPSGKEEWKEAKDVTQQDFVCIDFSGYDNFDYKPLNEVIASRKSLSVNGGGLLDSKQHFATRKTKAVCYKLEHFNENTITFPKYLDERMAEWLGWIFGDGNITEKPGAAYIGVQIGLSEPDLIDKYKKLAKDLFDVHIFANKRHDKKDNSISVRIASKQLIRFLRENNLHKGKAIELEIPTAIKESPASVRAAFLRGFFEADGTVEKNIYPACASISPQLIKDVQLLLQSIGIISKSFASLSREKSFGKNPLYRLIVTSSFGIKGFAEKVSFISERKKLALGNALSTLIERPFEQQWILPYFEEEFEEMYAALPSGRYEIRRATSKYFRETTGKTNFNKFRANRLIDKFPALEQSFVGALAKSNIYYDSVTIEKAGTGHVYDIEVNDGHEYLVNGMVVHNSGGTTRRAAKMVIVNADHPEIEDYILWKVKEEEKVADLYTGSRVNHKHLNNIMKTANEQKTVNWKKNQKLKSVVLNAISEKVPYTLIAKALQLAEQGVTSYDSKIFDMHYEGEAYQTVSGQNNNNTIRISNELMEKALKGGDWNLIARTNGSVMKTIKAADLFDKIAYAAWASADPGLQFDDTIQEWNTCPVDGRINATNPCVTGDTLVLTSEGKWIRIDKLIEKETELVTNLNVISSGVTKGSFKTGVKPVYKLETSSGYEVKLTADHQVYTVNRGFVQACELTRGDYVCLPSRAIAEIKELPVEQQKFYQLIGLYLGDGCGCGNSINITMNKQTEAQILEQMAEYCTNNFARLTHQSQAIQVQQTPTSAKLYLGAQSIVNKFSEYVDLSLKSHEKIISQKIFSLSLSEQKYILQGLFTSDGTVADYGEKSQYVALDSTSLQLLKDVQVLLSGFGIKAKIYKNRRAGKTTTLLPDGKGNLKEYLVKEVHSLRISRSSRILYEKLIGFIPESHKAEALRKLNERVTVYEDKPYDAVESLTYLGKQEVFDLTEPLTSSFIANGISVHNCSEFIFLDDTACNLASLNLVKFLNESGEFEVDLFKHAVRLWTIVLEITILMAQLPSKQIAKRTFETRALGLGYANLGTLLMVQGIPYDSEEGRAIAGAITAVMGGEAYATSAEMAKCFGTFSSFERNRDYMLKVVRNHRRAVYNSPKEEYEGLTVTPVGIDHSYCPEYLLQAAKQSWDKALELGEPHGFRNAQVSLLAPTGTISLQMDCDTTGIEPDFAIVKFKKLSGGGYLKIVNQNVKTALEKLGYSDKQVKEIEDYCRGKGTLEGCPHVNVDSLKSKGFTNEKVNEVEKQLKGAFDINFVFNKFTLGEEFCKKLGLTNEQLNDPDLNMLAVLGFTSQQIKEANDYVCGTMTIEGAPYLREEHYAIFDCANKCGKYGKRFIACEGHLKMMAAVQPFLSGAISKTINMPNEATIQEVKDAYNKSWKYMLKAIAIYRDGSKLSQPLNAVSQDEDELFSLIASAVDDVDETIGPEKLHEAVLLRGQKYKLPTKRRGFVQEARIGGHKLHLRTGEYPDGKLGEVFIDMYKEGASYRSLLNCFAIAISKGLQYGVPLEEYIETFSFTRFEPSGVVVGDDSLTNATSIIDYVFRVLEREYVLKQQPLAMVPKAQKTLTTDPSGLINQTNIQEVESQATALKSLVVSKGEKMDAKVLGYTGEQCGRCGSMKVKRNGACSVCVDCGETTGCS